MRSKQRSSGWQIGSGDLRRPSFSTFDGFVRQQDQFFNSHNTRGLSCAANALFCLDSCVGFFFLYLTIAQSLKLKGNFFLFTLLPTFLNTNGKVFTIFNFSNIQYFFFFFYQYQI